MNKKSLNFNNKSPKSSQMQIQKRIKTQGHQPRDLSDKKQRFLKQDKTNNMQRHHKQSQVHFKSISKDITPKKHSIPVHHSKHKEGNSMNKYYRNKQLTSVCSYSIMDRESLPVTKRKGSNARSVNGNATNTNTNTNNKIKKKNSTKKSPINQYLKSTVSNFSVLTKCLTEFIKEEKKNGKDPSMQILHLIKAFNRSEVAPVSKELEVLISNMLDYIEGTVGITKEAHKKIPHNTKVIKSRSSFSQASNRSYLQIFQDNKIPTTVKKQNNSTNQLTKIHHQNQQNNSNQSQPSLISKSVSISQDDLSNQESHPKFQRSVSKQNRELEEELRLDLESMHEQLYLLKNAGEKLQVRIDTREQDRRKLEEIYKKNMELISRISKQNKQQAEDAQIFHSRSLEDD